MQMIIKRVSGIIPFLAIFAALLAITGCARYARQVSIVYEPVVSAKGGSGDLYIVIPPDQQTQNDKIKWVIGKVENEDGDKIDEVMSPHSGYELVQDALGQELRKAGFGVIPTSARPDAKSNAIDLIKVNLSLDQVSSLTDIKATCRLVVSLDVIKNGALIKKLQYDSTFNKTDIQDRNLLASGLLRDTLQAAMQRAVPDIIAALAQ